VSQLEIGWFSTFLLVFGTISYQCIGDTGTISYLLLKHYSSSLAMIKPKILVTGATGKTGGAVVTELLAKGWPVRAAVRVRDARSDRLQRRGAEIVVVDIFDPNQLMDAMRGVQRAYYCPPYHPFVIQSASAFAVAARETGLEQIVGLSRQKLPADWTKTPHRYRNGRGHEPRRRPQSAACEDTALDVLQGSQGARQ
jgi:hypothetical protein